MESDSIIFGSLFLLVGLAGLLVGSVGLIGLLSRLYHIFRTKKWLVVWGKIQNSNVQMACQGVDDNGNRILISRPEILYRYEVDRREYTAQYGLTDWSSFESDALRVTAEYPLGSNIKVFFNHKNPGVSTLSTSYTQIPISSWVFIIIWLAFCGLIFWGGIQKLTNL